MIRCLLLVAWSAAALTAHAAEGNLVVNPSFTDGTSGWSPLWTHERGAGAVQPAPTTGHDGAAGLHLAITGAGDWSLEQQQSLTIHPGEVYALAGWVRGEEGAGELHLSAAIRDATGAVIAWEKGRRTSAGVHAWQHVTGRFAVPDAAAAMTFRVTGRGALVASLSGLELVRVAAAPHWDLPAQPLRIAAAGTSLEWSAAQRLLTLTAADGQAWQIAGLGDALPISGAVTAPDAMRIALRDAGGGDLTAVFTVEADGGVRCALTGSGVMEDEMAFPGPLRSRAGDAWVVPLNEGLLVPATDPHFSTGPLVFYGGHGLCMPFLGLVSGEHGLLALVETQDDAVADFAPPRDGAGSRWSIRWQPTRGQWGYARVVRLLPLAARGYVGIAKAYRAWAQRDGRVVTLREKAKTVPQVAQLVGAVDLWWWKEGASWTADPHPEIAAREFKDAGITQVLWSVEAQPEAVKAIRELGFLPGRYDIYQDVYAPETPITWATRDGWPDDLVLLPDGTTMKGWVLHENGREYPGGVICSQPGLARLRTKVAADLATHAYGARFLDTTTASPLRECWNPRHPESRSDDRTWKVAQLRAISGEFTLVCGSETGMDLAAPVVHYFEGMMSLGPYRLPDSGYDLFSYRKPQEDFLRFQVGAFYRIPLVELVYHDCLVSYWYWGDASNRVPEAWDERDLLNALYGTPPVFVTDRERWDRDRARYVQSYQRGGETARRTGWLEMLDHAFLNADHTLQRSRFADGTTVWANFGTQAAVLEDGTRLEAKQSRLVAGP